jgi:hypothetical protein
LSEARAVEPLPERRIPISVNATSTPSHIQKLGYTEYRVSSRQYLVRCAAYCLVSTRYLEQNACAGLGTSSLEGPRRPQGDGPTAPRQLGGAS